MVYEFGTASAETLAGDQRFREARRLRDDDREKSERESFIRLCSRGRLADALRSFPLNIPLSGADNLFPHFLHSSLSGDGSLQHALQIHAVAAVLGLHLRRFTSNHLLNAYCKLGDIASAENLFRTSMPMKNVMSFNILLTGLLRSGYLSAAESLFAEMPRRNVATWNAMVTGMAHSGLNDRGLTFFSAMRSRDLRPDEFALGSALRCCAGSRDLVSGEQIHGYSFQSGFLPNDPCVASSLAHVYMKCGLLEEGERVLRSLEALLPVVSYNTLIAGRSQNGDSEGAMECFASMRRSGRAADDVTFVSVISTCADLGMLGQGGQVHGQAVKAGVESAVPVRSALISMYSKCGCLSDARKMFDAGPLDRDLVLWTAMLAAYGFHGRGMEAVRLFERMVAEGIEPSEVTFLSLLYSCCHGGLDGEGRKYFQMMKEKYSLCPTLKHYTCIVDLLGRSGQLEEAELMVKAMPVAADAVIWKTLLAACKTHKDSAMAERVAGRVLELDPEDSASYVLLSNARAAVERWEDVSDVRMRMKTMKVRKEPGISWVELKGGEVHQFSTADRKHPKSQEISEFLEELMGEIRRRGYVADTAGVYHDMEDEEKEGSLSHHSEKLAVAFAIMSSPPSPLVRAPIRIMKNLRVCHDCHSALKFIAAVVEREIVLRDVSRFHHFSAAGGECSCGDHW